MSNENKIKKVQKIEDIIIDPNAKGGQTFQLDNGVTMAFVGKNEYYLIYKVIFMLTQNMVSIQQLTSL